jgi:predicted dehydrogenase
MPNPVRVVVAGGRRGSSFKQTIANLTDKLVLHGICDPNENLLAEWRGAHPGIKTYARYEEMLNDPTVDAVVVATPMALHAPQAIAALKAGKHVLSEVIAACTLDECWALVEAVEKSGKTYMMAENYCYTREAMLIKNMVEHGLFGELTYAEGAYIHDCRVLMYHKDKTRTWRGQINGGQLGRTNIYPTHSLGPVAQWLGILRTDRFVRTTTYLTKEFGRHDYAQALLGKDHPDAQPDAWSDATDSASTLIETEQGRVIVLRVDAASSRPHQMSHYVLQGSRGAYLSGRHHKESALAWIEGQSKGSFLPNSKEEPEWQDLRDFAKDYEHPRWKNEGETAAKAGHGGGDYFVIADFAEAVFTGKRPPIDVYDAVTWSCITPLSKEGVAKKGAAIDVPDFTRGKKVR